MINDSLKGLDSRRLQLWLFLFFLALAVPTAILIYQAYHQLKWEAFHQHQQLAEELAARIDSRLLQLIDDVEASSFTDYAFLVIAGDPVTNFLQRSTLSSYPVTPLVPGLIGYFQVDAEGLFSTPLLPQPGVNPRAYGISGQELKERLALSERIQQILSRNRLVRGAEIDLAEEKSPAPVIQRREKSYRFAKEDSGSGISTGERKTAEPSPVSEITLSPQEQHDEELMEERAAGQAAFDRLNKAPEQRGHKKEQALASTLGRVEDLNLDYRYQTESADSKQRMVAPQSAPFPDKRSVRKERSRLPEPRIEKLEQTTEADRQTPTGIRIRTFESELDPFEFSLLDSGHLVLFRKVWRDGQRYIQGALLEQQPFLQGVIQSTFDETILSQMSDLVVAYRGNVFSVFSGNASREYLSSAEEFRGALLYQSRLSSPLSDLELIFTITRLPAGPGSGLITWVALILTLVLCGGFYLLYRLGVGQIRLARQQQDFVSAVSHELKTPLTSIRMYGEILREGWASEEKKKRYYDYIHDESERLSRLISNVLQLARMTRNDLQVDLTPMGTAELMETIRPKVASLAERAGFELQWHCEGEAARSVILIDLDCFTQIIINLLDNAIKFSSGTKNKMITVGCQLLSDGSLLISVRDYGPGVPKNQMKKIFKLFYRSENELTRETLGTGIGLALVHQLTQSMNGKVDVINAEPGAEFRLIFHTSDPELPLDPDL